MPRTLQSASISFVTSESKDRYVQLTDAELESLEQKASSAVDITEFVPLSKVDPVYFEKTYYLGPGKGGDKPYRLLAEAMVKTDKVAVAKFVMRGKETMISDRPLLTNLSLVAAKGKHSNRVPIFRVLAIGTD